MASKDARLFIDNDAVVVRWAKSEFRFLINDIKAIGEMTNEWGPFAEDYFLCFVTTDDGRWREVSMSLLTEDLQEHLEQRVGAPFSFQLANITTFASNVLWPPHLAGTPMFDFKPPVPRTAAGRFLRRVGIAPLSNVQTLSPALLAAIRGT
jgi:hypothetical protein